MSLASDGPSGPGEAGAGLPRALRGDIHSIKVTNSRLSTFFQYAKAELIMDSLSRLSASRDHVVLAVIKASLHRVVNDSFQIFG